MAKLGSFLQGMLAVGAVLAVLGGAALGFLHVTRPGDGLSDLKAAYHEFLFGLLSGMLLAVSVPLIEALARRSPAPPEPTRPPALPAPETPASGPGAPSPRRPASLSSLYHEMKVYVDLEMWELALEKAHAILQDYPGTREAEIVSRLVNDIRWKAEPKFVSQHPPLTPDQEKDLREKGLAEMYRHVQTYMDLEMWELARQKALAIIRNFPESPQAIELMKIYDQIEKKALAPPGPDAPPKAGPEGPAP